jgi:sulfate adenylyltransferase
MAGALPGTTGFTADGPATLTVPAAVAQDAAATGALELVDPEGLPLATLAVRGTYRHGDEVGVVGEIAALAPHEYGPFRRLYRTPAEVHTSHPAAVTVPVTGPLTDADLDQVREKAAGRPVVLLALAGTGTPVWHGRPMGAVGLLRATVAAARHLDDAVVVAAPVASRGDAATDEELRATVVGAYAPGDVLAVTGEGDLPDDVAAVVRFELPPPDRQGLVVFFTGLSGSGKSTLARALHDALLEQGRRTVTGLDGDVVRRNLSAGLTFSREDRETNIRRIGWVAAEVSRHGGVAICSPIAPFDATRRQVREYVEAAGGAFFLVHVATPLAECERRDRKGLYAKARRGEIPDFTGISSPYEEPADAAVRVDTTGRSIAECLEEVLAALSVGGHLSSEGTP